ncbi:MAG TPA: xanthine dehydrogenase family protein subunit M [Stellaceae bacterium]|nr:xanthine dehydrogenase family protein subunit M [Stellaceae bacterium]
MKPAAFDYLRPKSVDEAIALLAQYGGDAKVLAGGQSLVPLLNFRVVRPSVLIDINRVTALDFVEEHDGRLRIGAMTRHHTLETSPLVRNRLPLLAAAMKHVGHLAVRNRGTIGGSLSHADPAAELPLVSLLFDATIHTNARSHAARDFFLGPLTTALADDELVTAIVLPAQPPNAGWDFEEFSLRAGDFAFAAVAATITAADGKIADARVAAMGVGETPLRLPGVEAALTGEPLTCKLVAEVAQLARDAIDPRSDLRASADYRRHLVAALTERALEAAWARTR